MPLHRVNDLIEPSGNSPFCVDGDTLSVQGETSLGASTLILHRK